MGGGHMARAIEGPGGVAGEHVIKVLQHVHFPRRFGVLQVHSTADELLYGKQRP